MAKFSKPLQGALSEINNNLQRVRELTVQASTGTNSASDLSSIQDEIKSRLSEIDRVSGQTQFNGVNVLAKDGKMSIQVGANDGETIDIDLKKIDSTTLGLNTFNVTGPVSKSGTLAAPTAANLQSYYGATTKVTATSVAENASGDSLATRLGVADGTVAFAAATVADDNGNLFAKVTITAGSAADVNNLKANGFEASWDGTTGSTKDYYIALDPKDADTSTATAAFKIDTSTISLTSITAGSTTDPLAKLDEAIASVDKFRSSLGAVQNRLSSAVTNLNNTTTNLSEAQSRIQDADYATEVSNMSKAQIIQQAGNSVLSKANQVPQQVLSLLQG
ncbi:MULTISPECIES: flagellin [unclassified Enterobacter cloacae complex]|uniref:flagellin n=1 Tax=unclassified Enterobacter cloacae complex TaxID=2757714 RepID=UPI00281637B5|nr:flagellin [Enterobacter cloacae complex sp. P36RS]